MRILVDIGHPGHVHFFKHAIRRWQEEGHRVMITARDKDVALDLLRHYGLDYTLLTSVGGGQTGLLREFIVREWKLWRIIRQFRPEVMTAVGGAFIAPVGKIAGVPTVVFTDTEHVALDRYLTYPWASLVCTPDCFLGDAGPRHKRYRGFQELAYLHPDYFTPTPKVLAESGLQPGERFALLRFVAWGASHDVGHSGFTPDQKRRLVRELSNSGRVLVSIEGEVPGEMAPFVVSIGPEKIHDLLHYASLYVGEGATMATEAALLGTPSVYVSSLVGTMGNFEMLQQYGLLRAYRDGEAGMTEALTLWDMRKEEAEPSELSDLLTQAVDVTGFIASTVTGSTSQ